MRRSVKKTYKTLATLDALAMSAAAFRMNENSWTKFETSRTIWSQERNDFIDNPEWRLTNSALISQFMDGQHVVTEEDRQSADNMRRLFQGMIFGLLADNLSDFTKKMMNLALGEEISQESVGMLAYMPQYYENTIVKRSVDDRLSCADQSFLSEVGSRVDLESVEILKRIISTKYDCVFYSGLTSTNHRVFFAYSGVVDLAAGDKIKCRATVKRQDAQFTTVLGRVKPVKI